MNKILSRAVVIVYLLTLTWLVLFKLTFHFSAILQYHHRSLNLVPFAAPSIVNGEINNGEMIANCLIFIPFGLLLCTNFKNLRAGTKLFIIFSYSLAAEILQYLLAIGATDITDLITNTSGGAIGLILYATTNRYIPTKKLDRAIHIAGGLIFLVFITIHTRHQLHRSLD